LPMREVDPRNVEIFRGFRRRIVAFLSAQTEDVRGRAVKVPKDWADDLSVLYYEDWREVLPSEWSNDCVSKIDKDFIKNGGRAITRFPISLFGVKFHVTEDIHADCEELELLPLPDRCDD
jgi:hypothetical protein